MSTGDPRFHALLKQLGDLHDAKQQDYGRQGDPFSNVRASEEFGITPWIGCMIRANDKMRRIQQFAKASVLRNESVEDSLLDLAVYSLIGLILYQEEVSKTTTPAQCHVTGHAWKENKLTAQQFCVVCGEER